MVQLEQRIRTTPLYQDLFVSRDLDWALLLIEPENIAHEENGQPPVAEDWIDEPAHGTPAVVRFTTSDDMAPLVDALQRVVERHRASGLRLRVGGGLVVGEQLGGAVKRDFVSLFGLAVLVIGVMVHLFFGSWLATALVLGVVLLSLGSSLGLMALLGIPVGFATQILPCFLLAAGVGYAVHVLTSFVQALAFVGDRRAAVEYALTHAGLPVFMAGLTTMGALASFGWAELHPVAMVGLVGPVGALFGLVYSLVLLPALLVVVDSDLPLPGRGWARLARVLTGAGDLAVARPRTVVFGMLLVALVSCIGISHLRLSHDPLTWIDADSPLRQTSEMIDREFGGAYPLEVVVEARGDRRMSDPDLLARMAQFEREVASLRTSEIFPGKVLGLHDVVVEIHAALEGTPPEETPLPTDRRVVAQELLLFENSGSDDLESLADPLYRQTRVTWADGAVLLDFVERLRDLADRVFGDDVDVQITGLLSIQAWTFLAVLHSVCRPTA